MTIEDADQLTEYLKPEINQGIEDAKQAKNLIRYKQLGLDYIQSCKDVAEDANGVIDPIVLKEKINDAIVLLQAYHDAL